MPDHLPQRELEAYHHHINLLYESEEQDFSLDYSPRWHYMLLCLACFLVSALFIVPITHMKLFAIFYIPAVSTLSCLYAMYLIVQVNEELQQRQPKVYDYIVAHNYRIELLRHFLSHPKDRLPEYLICTQDFLKETLAGCLYSVIHSFFGAFFLWLLHLIYQSRFA